MHALSCAFVALSLAVQAPARQPQWLADLLKIQQEMDQAPLGSLDARVERAWRAALEAPQYPEFQAAAQIVSGFYQSQGYDLKAEQVLRQALAAVPETGAETRWNLEAQLAGLFESSQQLVKALAIRKEAGSYELSALANLYERMGEFEKAEAAWQRVAAQRASETAAAAQRAEPRQGSRTILVRFGPPSGGQNELAGFYARRGRFAEAEQIYKKALADADQSGSPYEWNAAADAYAGFLTGQRRYGEAVDLISQSIKRMEQSSEPEAAQILLYKRQNLASVLQQAGRADDALAAQQLAVEAAQARSPAEYTQALGLLAQMLISQNRLDEAEKTVARMREAGASDTSNAKFHESMAVQILARIRDMQKKPEEARRLRASAGAPDVGSADRPAIYELAGSAQQAALEGNIDAAIASAEAALGLAAERVETNPQEVAGLASLARALMIRQRKAEAQRIAVQMLRIFDGAPDHPRVAEALGSLTSLMAELEMPAEAERIIERQERILVSAKGAGSPALNAIGYGRIALMQRERNWTGVIDERKRMLARTEKATGSKSRESLYALRELAFAYPASACSTPGAWPEEERLLLTLLERTMNLSGPSSVERAQLLEHMANRASQNREFEKALSWIGQAIEVARTLPDAATYLPGIVQNRARIVQAKDGPAPGTGEQWFQKDCSQQTGGAQLGSRPVGEVLVGPPAVIRSKTATAPAGAPAQAPPIKK
jgi:hypothetical protein